MSGGRVIGLFLLISAVLLSPVAAEFSLSLTTVEDVILPQGTALFELDVTNDLDFTDRYGVASDQFDYILILDPRPGDVESGETVTFGIEITPRNFVNYGTHVVPITVRSQETGLRYTIEPIIFIRDPNRSVGEYTPSIALSLDAPDTLDPREDLTLGIGLRNRNARSYTPESPVTVQIESDIFYEEYQTNLGSVGDEGEKSTEYRVDLDPYQVPGDHPLTVRVVVDGQIVSTQETRFEIIAYSEVNEVAYDQNSLFKQERLYRLTNDGNRLQETQIVYPINPFQRIFISSSHNYEVTEVEGQLAVVVPLTLEPLQEVDVSIEENYRLLALLILLIILSVAGYYFLRSPVVLGKEAQLLGSEQEGVSQITVRIFVKNRSAKTMRNLRVIDRITGVADIVKEDGLGTLKPTKVVKKKGQGTLLRWDLEQLEPFEERIISYKAKTPLKLVGDVTLPSVKVKFDVPSGRERTSHSNEVSVSRR